MVRLSVLMSLAIAGLAMATLAPALAAERAVCVENATISDLGGALAAGRTSAADLVRAYSARIEAFDRSGSRLNAIREMNPDAPAIAAALDARTASPRRPLEGIPILVKDNIATGDAQHTTAGSLALADAYAQRDATVVKLLRDAGAVILGKTNLTEFANILAIDMPSGYSSLGGQVKNPYAPQVNRRGDSRSSSPADRARALRWRWRRGSRRPRSAPKRRARCSRRLTRTASSR